MNYARKNFLIKSKKNILNSIFFKIIWFREIIKWLVINYLKKLFMQLDFNFDNKWIIFSLKVYFFK